MEDFSSAAFFAAAFHGDHVAAEHFSKDPAVNINWQNEKGFTPLAIACQEDKIDLVRFLLGLQGLDPNLPAKEGSTPFFLACSKGHVTVTSLLLADQRVDVNKQREGSATPFFVACHKGHVDVVSLLLADKRVDVNKPADNGASPLFMACQYGHVGVVSLLLADKRADCNRARNDGATPFAIAAQNGCLGVVSLLLADPRVDVNKASNDQSTPLWLAASHGQLHVVQHLLAHGREIDTKARSNSNNKTAAEQARANGLRAKKSADESDETFKRCLANGRKIAELIEAFEKEYTTVRSQLRKQLGMKDSLPSLAPPKRNNQDQVDKVKKEVVREEIKQQEDLKKVAGKEKEKESEKGTPLGDIAQLRGEVQRQGKLLEQQTLEIEELKVRERKQAQEIEELKKMVAGLLKN